jgi:hypothetical protein
LLEELWIKILRSEPSTDLAEPANIAKTPSVARTNSTVQDLFNTVHNSVYKQDMKNFIYTLIHRTSSYGEMSTKIK